MTDIEFETRNHAKIAAMAQDEDLHRSTQAWLDASHCHEYSYHFEWMGMPIIQYPQDIVALQELMWRIRPDTVIETGIARGGSLVFYSSMFEMMGIDGLVVGIDIDIRQPNRKAIEEHPQSGRITMIEGSSTDPAIVSEVAASVAGRQKIMVVLDSNHTHDHVLDELKLYSAFVSPRSYLVVFDTIVERMPVNAYPNRPWGRGNNPSSALDAFLAMDPGFEVDRRITDKLQITAAPGGYLRRVQS